MTMIFLQKKSCAQETKVTPPSLHTPFSPPPAGLLERLLGGQLPRGADSHGRCHHFNISTTYLVQNRPSAQKFRSCLNNIHIYNEGCLNDSTAPCQVPSNSVDLRDETRGMTQFRLIYQSPYIDVKTEQPAYDWKVG
jgi:hypothetical protein